MIHAMIDLTIRDCKNILLWYELYFKMQAMAISQKDEDERFSRI